MGNNIYKKCIEDKTQHIVKKFNDKIKKLRLSFEEISESEYNNLLYDQHFLVLVDTFKNKDEIKLKKNGELFVEPGDMTTDPLKERVEYLEKNDDKEKLCDLSMARCLVKRTGPKIEDPEIKYFKSCLEKTENERHIENKYTINDSHFPSNFKSRVRSTKKSKKSLKKSKKIIKS